jgi:hypothetical protein
MFSLKALRSAAEELNDVMGLKPPIDTNGTVEDLVASIKDSIQYIDPKLDHFTKGTQAVIDELGKPEGNVDGFADNQTEDDNPDGIVNQIEDAAKLNDLKTIAKTNDLFKEIRGQLSSYRTADQLREDMLALATPDNGPEAEYVNPDRDEEPEEEAEEPVITKSSLKKPKVIIPSMDDDEEPEEEVKKPKNEFTGIKPKGSGSVKYFEKSAVVKGLSVGSEVMFLTSFNSKVAPNKSLMGKVTAIKVDPKKSDTEYVKIQTKLGVFYKTSKSVTITK